MLGAIIGDTVGSVYEFENIKTTEFDLFSPESIYTDDSVMTMAVADWLFNDKTYNTQTLVDTVVYFANEYPCPKGGYGDRFLEWLTYPDVGVEEIERDNGTKGIVFRELRKPYNSWGNCSAMRTSAVGWMFDTLEETELIAVLQAGITHNHPEGIKGAQAVSAAIFMARNGMTKEDIKLYIESKYGYDLSKTCDEIRPYYEYNESCQGTVPQAMIAFFESTDFESCVRLAVSLGGDCDTLTCISAAIAEAFYKDIPRWIVDEMWKRLPGHFKEILCVLNSETKYNIVSYLPLK